MQNKSSFFVAKDNPQRKQLKRAGISWYLEDEEEDKAYFEVFKNRKKSIIDKQPKFDY